LRTRSTKGSSARFGFEADTGRIHYLRPVVRADLRRSHDAIRSPLPFRLFPTLRIKAFNQLHHNKLASPDARLSFAPRGALFRFSPRINARNPSSPCLANRSVNHRHARCSIRGWMLTIHRLPLASNAFRRVPGQCKKRFLRPRILPEPETRNGLSLARNDAFATITRSTLPPCSFASTPVFLRVPARSKAPPLGSVSKPKPGEFFTYDPLSAPISGALAMSSDLHSPSGGLHPPDQSVQPASSQQARLA